MAADAMRGWTVGDKVTDDRGVTGTITGLDAMGAWLNVRGHIVCVAWGAVDGMPDRETYDRRRAARELPLLATGGAS